MRIAIHQPHYFPWLGYLDKIKKSDVFVLLDEVQFEKGSLMNRNRVVDSTGSIQYLTISSEMKGHLSQSYKNILTKNDQEWKYRQENALRNYYQKSKNVDQAIAFFHNYLVENKFHTLNEWTCASIQLCMKALGISTPIIFQSQIDYDREMKKSDLVLSICHALGANEYLSGMGGSVEYLNRETFLDNGVSIVFQQFEHPEYHQCNTDRFIAGLSILDLFFNCGIEGAKQILSTSFLRDAY